MARRVILRAETTILYLIAKEKGPAAIGIDISWR
jgi:hypothetical protein